MYKKIYVCSYQNKYRQVIIIHDSKIVSICPLQKYFFLSFFLSFIYLADTFIQSDLQLRNTIKIHHKEANKLSKCLQNKVSGNFQISTS